ncbi:MAG: hypothetical protein ABIP02_01325 [Arenimonas sp.]
MSDSQQEGLQHFVSKWYAREPEMQFAEVFVPASQKQLFRAWGALLHEVKHTLFELSDTNVTQIKTAWWADEFQRLAQAQPRHPVTHTLTDIPASWTTLSSSLFTVIETASERSSDTEQAIANFLPFANALVAIEDKLFSAKSSSPAENVAVHCLLHRLPHGLADEDRARIPMHLIARHSINAEQLPVIEQNALLQDWATELNSVLSDKAAGTVFRRARTRFDQAQLAHLMAGKGMLKAPAPANLWRAWRAAIAQPR